ncbi:DUF72 domain-containing protein [Niastella caeni]|uniref:DUF72 domain-containing protein n=1 Tax=Niastella caeni TaxID=2569763 RepID=A0A4S8I4R8_9BACT|nr:DUF72 domain-containing protein [Niastella caeni]THU41762.1 DUF72 domain-containing protein [Niastella caeni]
MANLQWHIGCSGFHYKEWKELFYPKGLPQRLWLDYYCQHFSTLELNVTFYRFPQLSFLLNWYQKTPAHFAFAVKAPRLITHYKKFEEAELLLNDFYTTIQKGLQEKLACVLFQLPAQLSYSEVLLQKIVRQLNSAFNNVVEFRHSSWWQPNVYETLARHRISFCSISHPQLPDEVISNTDTIYYRFHGVPQLYYSAYDQKFLEQVFAAIKNAKQAKQAFIYFNNTAQIAAIQNAQYVQQLVRQ